MTRAAASGSTWRSIEVSNREGTLIATSTPDGVWWVDWDEVRKSAALPVPTPSEEVFIVMCRLLLAAYGNLPEVDRNEADRLAIEWGARLEEASEA
jgi:hypothetical protein